MSLRIYLTKKGGKSHRLTMGETIHVIANRHMRLPDGEADLDAEVTLRWTRPRKRTSKCKGCGCEIAKGEGSCGECACEDDGV